MNALDGDDAKLSYNGKAVMRDIVQFVPFNKFYNRSHTALAEETLREVPKQVTDYFAIRQITPNPALPPAPTQHKTA